MKDFLKLIEKKIKDKISIEKIIVIDNSSKHKTHKFFDKNKYHICLQIESKYLKYFTNTKDIEFDSFSEKKIDEKRRQRVYNRLLKEVKTDLKIVHQVDSKLEKVKAS